MADVNGDGLLDIYVCKGGFKNNKETANLLFINQGNNTFKEEAEKFNLASQATSVQATFFDYDLDGDLDMYLLNSSTFSERAHSPSTSRTVRNARAGDKLFRNDGARFVDVSENALYWYFVVASWLLIYGTIYWAPRIS